MTTHVRYPAAHPNRRGVRVGVFALAHGRAHDGTLTDEEHTVAWRVQRSRGAP